MDQKTLGYAAISIGKQYPFIQKDRGGRVWEPHLDDGDAMRISVALNLTTKHRFLEYLAKETARCEKDYCKAMRRAIVRTAAEIGKSMMIENTQTEDACPIDSESNVLIMYENGETCCGKASDWDYSWNITRVCHIEKYRVI